MFQLAVAVVLLVASYVIQASMQKGPQPTKPNTMEDFDFPTFDEGTPQCVVFGDCWVPDWMVLHYGGFEVREIRGKSGKK